MCPASSTVSGARRRAELIALPSLASRADVAMCRFRSEASSSSSSSLSAPPSSSSYDRRRWEALDANDAYRRALAGAAGSLARSAASLARRRGRPQRPVVPMAEAEAEATELLRRRRRSEGDDGLRKAMTDVALATLMAGIAASHLRMHRGGDDDVDDDGPWTALVDAAVSAADVVLARRAWATMRDDDDEEEDDDREDGPRFSDVVDNVGRRRLEGSLLVLNEEMPSRRAADDRCGRPKIVSDEEVERWNVAMHMFRSALKVAALATGRLILPRMSKTLSTLEEEKEEAITREGGLGYVRKKRKLEAGLDEGGGNSATEADAWNVVYVHSSPTLRSRERLVDAISFHSAAARCPRNRLTLIIALDVRRGGGSGGGEVDDDLRKRRTKNVRALELLASSSSSRFARDLLGCVRAGGGDPSGALEALQSSLEDRARQSGGSGSHDDDEEASDGMAERRSVANMALCLASMGETKAPLELLLHTWMLLSSKATRNFASNVAAPPVALLLSCAACERESTSSSVRLLELTKLQLLWKLYQAASIAQDWSTCLSVTDELLDMEHCDDICDISSHGDIARVFALLQCRRTSAALDATRVMLSKLALYKSETTLHSSLSRLVLCSLAELYHADGLLLDENCTEDFAENEDPWECTQRAIDTLDSVAVKMNAIHDVKAKGPLTEFQIAMLNDHGIALLMKGDSVGALRCLREAAKRATCEDAFGPQSWSFLPTHFNLSLLLLRDGRIDECAKSWLRARGHFDMWQKALRGDNEALQGFKNLCVVAINRHGLLMAKRGMTEHAGKLWVQEIVMEWIPPAMEDGVVMEDSVRIYGVDAAQISAMDVLLLKYALSNAEKKSSLLFRRSAGHVGY
ncbi:hypothetical protein ACHAW5_009747 [Stephanodiscus triporus]|uniref:Uncharacterized protein n=1 Tax=Stephanodiscus triporus TaxID=2934178 RepID=A0ABD3MNU9_9STRA